MNVQARERAIEIALAAEIDKWNVSLNPEALTRVLMLAWLDGAATQAKENADLIEEALS